MYTTLTVIDSDLKHIEIEVRFIVDVCKKILFHVLFFFVNDSSLQWKLLFKTELFQLLNGLLATKEKKKKKKKAFADVQLNSLFVGCKCNNPNS